MRMGAMRTAVLLFVVLGLDAEAVEVESNRDASSEDAIDAKSEKQINQLKLGNKLWRGEGRHMSKGESIKLNRC